MDLNLIWFILLGVLLAGIRDTRRLRSGSRNHSSDPRRPQRTRHRDQSCRTAVGWQRSLAGHFWWRAVRRFSRSLRHHSVGDVSTDHAAFVLLDPPRDQH